MAGSESREGLLEACETAEPNTVASCISRRRFIFAGAAALSTVALASVMPGRLLTAVVAAYDGARVGSIKDLRPGVPQRFRYPWDHANCESYLIKLGVQAGGGIGPDSDIVAFNTLCPHMGFSLLGQFKQEHQVLGPCPWHLTTYDLTRHGIVIAGHATEGLPQVLLEARGDDIYAVGMQALIFGFGDNEVRPVA